MVRKVNIENGIFAIKNTDPYDFLGTKPPLGTVDADGVKTSGISIAPCDSDPTKKKSQAVMGAFELLYGKVTFSETTDQESSDSNDVTVGRDKVKGYQNITGTFDFHMLFEDNRMRDAVLGKWNFLKKLAAWNPYFREYEIWVAMEPDVQSPSMTECERLFKFLGVKLERSELETSNPNTTRLPIFAMQVQEISKWNLSEWAAQDLFTSPESVAATTSFDPDESIQEDLNTRLKFAFDSVTASGLLRVTGIDIFGRRVVEEITLSQTGTYDYITKNYFSSVDVNGIYLGTGWSGGTFQVSEYDVGLLPP